MKYPLCFLMFIISFNLVNAQSLAGEWEGYYTYDNPAPQPTQLVTSVETRVVTTVVKGRSSGNPVPANRIPYSERGSYSRDPSPSETYAKRLKSTKVTFNITCTQNEDGTYNFTSHTRHHREMFSLAMDYEIIGNDTLYLVETVEPQQDELVLQQMLLHITWEKKGKRKVMKMQGAWYNAGSNVREGEVILYRKK